MDYDGRNEWQQLGALLRRNLLLKYRAIWKTIYEVLYPLYFVLILVIIRATTNSGSGTQWPTDVYEPTALLPPLQAPVENVVLTAPNDTETLSFMQEAMKRISDDGSITVVGLSSEADMTEWHRTDPRVNLLLGAVGFGEPTDVLIEKARASDGPFQIPFTLRLNSSRLPEELPIVVKKIDNCRGLLPENFTNCPARKYVTSYFSTLQLAVTTEFTERLRGETADSAEELSLSATGTQMPTGEAFAPPPDVFNAFMPIFLSLGFIPVVQYLIVNIVSEKEKGRKFYLHVLGIRSITFWTSWGIIYFGTITLSVTIMTIIIVATKLFSNLDFGALFFLLFAFGMATMTQAFAFTTFFDKAKLASTCGSVAYLLTTVLFFAFRNTPLAVKYVACLLPPVAVALGMDHVTSSANVGEDITASTMFTGEPFTLGSAFVMLLFDIVFYTSLTWYLDQVLPTEFGVPKKWYFIFDWRTYFGSRGKKLTPVSKQDEEAGFVEDPMHDTVALRIQKLTKTFTKTKREGLKRVVETTTANDNISFDAKDGEIMGLLGHNGAGKSTLINLLVGLSKPTSGTASLFSMSIDNDMDKIRDVIGIVPQSNDFLYDELKCHEHLMLVAGIKGLRRDVAKEHGRKLLEEVGLQDQIDQVSKTLSGGQKRKLCLAMALIGSPKLLILDEHSAGVDVFARRHLWQVLQKNRENRITLVASHFLDEVEALCDRVVVLDRGHIRCMGTPLKLKSEFHIAYRLIIAASKEKHALIVSAVQRHIPSAVVNDSEEGGVGAQSILANDPGAELSISLPLEAVDTFADMFEVLEGQEGRDLSITNMNLALPTLEQVFIRLEEEKAAEIAEEAEGASATAGNRGGKSGCLPCARGRGEALPSVADGDLDDNHGHREDQKSNRRSQFYALLKLNWLARSREGGYWFFVTFLPIALLVAGLALARVYSRNLSEESTSTKVDFTNGFETLANALSTDAGAFSTLVAGEDADVARSISTRYPSDVDELTAGRVGMNLYFLDRLTNSASLKDPVVPSAVLLGDVEGQLDDPSSPLNVNVDLSSNFSYVHELPTACTRFSTALLRLVTGNNELSFRISSLSFQSASLGFDVGAFFSGYLLVSSFTLPPSAFAIPIVKSRELGLDHALRMAGTSRFILWLVSYVADLCSTTVILVASIIAIAAFKIAAFMGAAMLPFVIGVMLFSLMMILHSFVWSFAFSSTEVVTNVLPTLLPLFAQLPFAVLFNVGTFASFTATKIANAVLIVLLPPSTIASLLYFLIRVDLNRQLGFIKEDELTVAFFWTTETHIYPAIIAMCGHILISVALLYYFDVVRYRTKLQANRKLWSAYSELQDDDESGKAYGDHDVHEEQERVRQLFGAGNPDSAEARKVHIAACIVSVAYQKKEKHAKKKKFKVAVDKVSLALSEGQRVGLLGPNGAGKTSLFSVLTGSIGASGGSAFIGGHNIEEDPLAAFRTTGFTSQHNRIWNKLTMREHLELFAKLQGVPKERVPAVCERLMAQLDVLEHADKWSSKLSGGTKRKLSLALGTIGSPIAQIHDEPSAGLDVFAQQKMWDAVRRRTRNASAIISTHSMPEAYALCNMIVIMTDGHIRCIGTPQHLLDLYGQGFMVEILTSDRTSLAVGRFVKMLFPDARVLDAFGGRCRFHVLISQPHVDGAECENAVREVLTWDDEQLMSEEKLEAIETSVTAHDATQEQGEHLRPSFATIFRTFAAVKQHLHIDDFTISQPTLEQIFNRFAASAEKVALSREEAQADVVQDQT